MSLSAWRTPTLAVDLNAYPSNCPIFASRHPPIQFQRWIWCIIGWILQHCHQRACVTDFQEIGKGLVLVSLSYWRTLTVTPSADLNAYPSNCPIFTPRCFPIKFQMWIWCKIGWGLWWCHWQASSADCLKNRKRFGFSEFVDLKDPHPCGWSQCLSL